MQILAVYRVAILWGMGGEVQPHVMYVTYVCLYVPTLTNNCKTEKLRWGRCLTPPPPPVTVM